MALGAVQRLLASRQRHALVLFPLRRDIPAESRGQTPFFSRWLHLELHLLLVGVVHDGVPAETLLHGEGSAAAGLRAHERALLLVERENVALEVEHGGVGPAAALPGTAAHVPLGGVRLRVLPQVILAFKCSPADAARERLFMSFSHVFQKLCPCFCHKRTFFLTNIAFVDLPVPLQAAGGSEVFPASVVGTLEQRFVGVLALVGFQLLVFLKGLLTTFKAAYILFLLVFMFPFKMLLQV